MQIENPRNSSRSSGTASTALLPRIAIVTEVTASADFSKLNDYNDSGASTHGVFSSMFLLPLIAVNDLRQLAYSLLSAALPPPALYSLLWTAISLPLRAAIASLVRRSYDTCRRNA